MNTQEKAQEIVNNFKKHSNEYVGSSMLTNTEFQTAMIEHSKSISKNVVRQVLEILEEREVRDDVYVTQTRFYNQVLLDIDQVL